MSAWLLLGAAQIAGDWLDWLGGLVDSKRLPPKSEVAMSQMSGSLPSEADIHVASCLNE